MLDLQNFSKSAKCFFFACQILSEMLKDVLQRGGWSRGLYNQLVSRRVSGDFRVIWHNLQPLMGTFTFLEGKGKVKLKLVNIQHPTAKQSTSPQKRSCFQFQILFYNKTAIFHFSENTSKRLGCKNGILRLREKIDQQTNKFI